MPWTYKQVKLLHAVDEGKSNAMSKAEARKMLAEQHGHKVLPAGDSTSHHAGDPGRSALPTHHTSRHH